MASVLFLFIFREEISGKSLISDRIFSRSALSRRNRITSSAYITNFCTALTIFSSVGKSGRLIPLTAHLFRVPSVLGLE